MAIPTDHGTVVLRTERDGTRTVMVCDGFRDGQPVGVYAVHRGSPAVQIHSGVALVKTRAGEYDSYTAAPAAVSRDEEGVIHVIPGLPGRGLLDRL